MRVLNKPTIMIAALLALSACQADEKQAKAQASMPPTVVFQPSQLSQAVQPVVQTDNTTAKASASTNVTKPRASDQARMQQAKAAAAARQQMGMQLAAAMKKAAEKKAVEKSVAEKPLMPAGDAKRGKKLARKCVACHAFGRRNKMGPGLIGVFNRQAGTFAGYRYTYAAFIAEGKAWHWDAAHLAAWLCDSKAAVRAFTGNPAAKTRMPQQRICDTGKQRDIIAYLKTL